MATETLQPDGLLDQTGLTGALADIDEDPGSPDANWLTTGSNTSTVCRVSFPAPSGSLTTGAGLQAFRALVRKTAQSTDPDVVMELWEAGALVSTLIAAQALSSTTGIVLTGTFDASSLAAGNGQDVECRVTGTPGGGNPGNRASVEVGAVAWDVTYDASAAAVFRAGGPRRGTRSMMMEV